MAIEAVRAPHGSLRSRKVVGSRLRRGVALAGLATRASARVALATLVPGPGKAARKERAVLRTADDVVRVMGDMKGVAMKAGQILSLSAGTVPAEFAGRLQTLQSSAPPMSEALMRSVFEEDFGCGPDKLFRRFDPEPFAAASIGQVHRAELSDRRRVAVKVQYPGVREAVGSDLANLGVILGLAGAVAPGLEPAPIVADLRRGIEAELDYAGEAERQQRFGELFRGHPFIRIPSVHRELSSSRVLVQEYVDGRPFSAAQGWSQSERDRLAEILFRFTFGTMHRHGLFQADPHAGNYLLLDDGTVSFVDFGSVVSFEPQLRERLNSMIAGVVSGDIERWRAGMEAIGYVPAGIGLTTEELWEHMRLYYTFVLEDGVEFTPELATAMVRQNLQLTGETGRVNRKLNIPEGLVFTQRINFGFTGLLAGIRARGPWKSIIEEYVVGNPPSTDLGRLSAEHAPTSWV